MISIAKLRQLRPRIVCLGTHPGIIQSILDYDYLCGHERPSIVAIISHGHKQERYFWGENETTIPVLPELTTLPLEQKASINCLLNLQSARRVLGGTAKALAELPNLQVASIFAEQVPEAHALALAKLAEPRGLLIMGPASVGILIPGVLKLGAIGGTQHPQILAASILTGGNTAVISTSGGMVNELIHSVTGSGLGLSFAIALGGDRFPITNPAQAFLLAQADKATEQIVYFGELGGSDEYEIAELIRQRKVTKKVIAYIAGTVAELFETPPQFGHAKAMAETLDETALAKRKALRQVGVHALDTFADLAPTLAKLAKHTIKPDSNTETRTIGPRTRHLIVSHISGEQHEDVQLLGQDLLKTVNQNSIASLTLSLLLGRQITSKKLIEFTDYVLRLLVDHGPYVSGAVNTIISARAGKDLASSLATGLLTIGPRFGGAINAAAGCWLQGVSSMTPHEFVDSLAIHGGIIPGIGHKKYRLDLPDPRVHALCNLAPDTKNSKYLNFARGVEAITTTKKGNLILNVDGAIAAILLDLLESELGYDYAQLQELVDIEFFNALFILSRAVGFSAHYLDQRRHDEGLLRLSDQQIAYLPPSE